MIRLATGKATLLSSIPKVSTIRRGSIRVSKPHTEELHVIEHISRVGDKTLLEVKTTVEDRKALTSPYSYSRYYKKTDPDIVRSLGIAGSDPETICNGDPGEQEEWSSFWRKALTRNYVPPDEKSDDKSKEKSK